MIDGNIEKSLYLPRVEVGRYHTVGTGFFKQVGNQLRRDRFAGAGLSVLARVAEIGHDKVDMIGRGPFERVNDDKQLDKVFVRRLAGRLDHINVCAADALLNGDSDLTVGKPE